MPTRKKVHTEPPRVKVVKVFTSLLIASLAFYLTTRIDSYSTKLWVNQLFGLSLAVMVTACVYAFVKFLTLYPPLEKLLIISIIASSRNHHNSLAALDTTLKSYKKEQKQGPVDSKIPSLIMLAIVIATALLIAVMGDSASDAYLGYIVVFLLTAFFIYAMVLVYRSHK